MRVTALTSLRDLRRRAREQAEAQFCSELAGLRAAEDQVTRCAARQAIHVAGRFAVASARLATLEDPDRRDRARVRPGLDAPLCQAQLHESRERLLRAEEALLEFGRQRAARRLAEAVARVAEGQALLTQAERRLEVVERFLANRAEAERARHRRREEREADDYSSSRNSSL